MMKTDKNVKISDLNNLSEAQITDLSLYASSLINQIRTAFGTTQTSVSKGSVLAADRVSDGYVADNWGWEAMYPVNDMIAKPPLTVLVSHLIV